MKEASFEPGSGGVQYLGKYSSIPPATVNSSCTTICETFDELTNDESEKNHTSQSSLKDENEFGGINYKCVNEYDDVFKMSLIDSNYFNNIPNSNQMNSSKLSGRELSNIQMNNMHLSNPNVINSNMNHMVGSGNIDYNTSCVNYYPESLNDYSNGGLSDYPNGGLNDHEENSINDFNVNYNPSIDPKYSNDNNCTNNSGYPNDRSGYGVENNRVDSENYVCKDEGFLFDGYKGEENVYSGGNYYINDIKYNMYNMSQFVNPDENALNPIDNSFNNSNDSFNVPMHSSASINQNQPNPMGTYDNPNPMSNFDPQNPMNSYDPSNPMSNYNCPNYNGTNPVPNYTTPNLMIGYNDPNYDAQNPISNFNGSNYENYEEGMYDLNNYNNVNCISGVKYQRTDNRWIARWTTAEGKRACKSFSVNIYGFNQAKMLAIQARQKGVALSGRSFCNRERQHAMKSGVGIIGIRFDKTQARWVSSYYEGGKRKFRYFTVKDYGYEQAKRNAIIWKSCNDERLVKRVKEGYGINYGVPNIMPNIIYPVEGYPYACGVPNSIIPNNLSNNLQMNPLDLNKDQKDMELNNQNFIEENHNFNDNTNTSNNLNENNSEFVKDYEGFNNSGNLNSQLNNSDGNQNDGELDEGYRTMVTVNNFSNFDQNESTISSGRNDYFYCSDSHDESGDSETTGIGSDECEESDSDSVGEGADSRNRVSYDGKKGRWVSEWRDVDGKKVKKYFEVHKYGYKKAKQMALANNKLI
ncbi:uncharacterized protein TA05055 [Theileria annulata]|uniref:AP2/ERF domain-containing protein n=1 Tax=Theileria annulata TaxID=5874 RepID=Q4UBQ3_THEAN|nr:uncharacterized protein TA05055 [Theileria annulata]CAI75748.1 hypothetical protein TA05055 [Theileria annulata]|eukprot:XP_955224.1 hypothetical protein TA05055 [Theileria annulata]